MSAQSDISLLDCARRVSLNRRRRQEFLPAELFGEPAWNMMLALFIANLEDRVLSVDAACEAAGVSASTALRWVDVLERLDLVERSHAMVATLRLSTTGSARMMDLMRSYASA